MTDQPKRFVVSQGDSPESIASAIIAGILSLFGIRAFCTLVNIVADLLGGWIRPTLYQQMGERNLRRWWILYLIGPPLPTALVAYLGQPSRSPLGVIVAVWAFGFALIEWRTVKWRTRERIFVYSRFLGIPRFLPVSAYNWQPVIPLAIGLVVTFTGYDAATGGELVVAALCAWARLWCIATIRHEDALDVLDASWVADYQRQAAEALAAGKQLRDNDDVAQATATIDLVRSMSQGF